MSTVSYDIHEMGIICRGLSKLISMINTYHRIITTYPVCLSHESTQNFFDRLNLIPPWTQLQQKQARIEQALFTRAARFRLEAMTEIAPMPVPASQIYGLVTSPCLEIHRIHSWLRKSHVLNAIMHSSRWVHSNAI